MSELPPASETTFEHELIGIIRDLTDEHLIGDDCAILPGGNLVTADTLVEGTHFLRSTISLSDLGWKAVAVNLSDIAAMAGRPRYVISCLTLPPHFTRSQFAELYSSMVECARRYRTRIVGGDLTRGDQLVLTLTVIGDTHENGILTRQGGKPGDVIITTGDFGASAAGLWLIQHQQKGFVYCKRRHCRPMPRLCESWALLRACRGDGALMDASDGLADALIQLAEASNISIEIDAKLIPVHHETIEAAEQAEVSWLDWSLYGGEDYELVGSVPQDIWQTFKKLPDNPFTEIGTAKFPGAGVQLHMENGTKTEISIKKTYQHWPC